MRLKNKIGFIADETHHTVRGVLDWIGDEHDVDGIELRKVEGKHVHELSRQKLVAIKKMLDNENVDVHAIASPLGKGWFLDDDGNPNTNEIQKHLAMVEPLIAAAAILGTDKIRIFGGKRKQDTTSGFEVVLDFFKAVLEKMPASGLALTVENEDATFLSTLSDVACLYRNLGHDKRIKALFDPGNYFFATSIIRALKVLGKNINDLLELEINMHFNRIALVHVKNLRPDNTGMKGLTVALDQGDIDYKRVLGRLKVLGIEVPYDLEPHRTLTGQLDEHSRHQPGDPGYANPENVAEDLKTLENILSQI